MQSTIVEIEYLKYQGKYKLKLRNKHEIEIWPSEMDIKKYKIGELYVYTASTYS